MSSSEERRAAFAAAGLPVPIYVGSSTGSHDSRLWDARVGFLAHRVIAQVVPVALSDEGQQVDLLLRPIVADVVKDRRLGRLDRARARVTGVAVQYLKEFMPSADSVFLGAEVAAGGGRVDLVWQHSAVGVWFDELKTWRRAHSEFDDETWRQIDRYLVAGQDQFGSAFAGLRLLTLGNLGTCVAIDPQGLVEPLASSRLSPTRIGRGVAA